MAVTSGWDLGSEAERKPECDGNPCKVQRGLPHSKTRSASRRPGGGRRSWSARALWLSVEQLFESLRCDELDTAIGEGNTDGGVVAGLWSFIDRHGGCW
jgi:hypothetical protein